MDNKIQLLNVPNQTLTVRIGSVVVNLSLNTHNGILYASTKADGVRISAGVRCVPNGRITPRSVRRLLGGYLAFRCDDSEYPFYKYFGKSCNLVYEA